MRQKQMTYEEAEQLAVERLRKWHSHYLSEHQFKSIVGSVLVAIGFTEKTQVVEAGVSNEGDTP